MRYVALAALVVLVGGFVVGQERIIAPPREHRPLNSGRDEGPGPARLDHVKARIDSELELAWAKHHVALNRLASEPNDRAAEEEAVSNKLVTEVLSKVWFGRPDRDQPGDRMKVIRDTGFVGRYVPFGNDRLLDTTNGTLYRINGNVWVDAVKMREPKQATRDEDTAAEPESETGGLDLDELLKSQ